MARILTDSDPIQNGYDEFGACPHCRKNDGYLNVGGNHWFHCKEHKTCWCFGCNIFSSWHSEDQADWDKSIELVLPLLTAGVVESIPSTVLQVFYRLTNRPMPEVAQPPEVEQTGDSSLWDVYAKSFNGALASLDQLQKTNEIVIPLPATR